MKVLVYKAIIYYESIDTSIDPEDADRWVHIEEFFMVGTERIYCKDATKLDPFR